MNKRQVKTVGIAMLVAAAMVPAMFGSAVQAAQNVLVVAKAEDPPSCDPGIEISNNGYTLTYAAYERLVKYKGATTEVEPELAKSWTSDAGGLVWTFALADGHKFDDGSPVDAAAVKFSFDRLKGLGEGPADAFPTLHDVAVVDPMTVRMTLSKPFAPFLSALATSGAAIINPKAMEHEKDGDKAKGWLAEHTAGSGAYTLTSWERNQTIILDRNPNYAGAAPALKRIVFKIVRESSARRLQIEHGDVDIIEQVPVDQAEAMKDNAAVVVESNPSLYVDYIYMNNRKPPLDDVRVRQAISYAIDYKGLVDGVMHGQAVQMRGPVPQGLWGHDPNAFQYSYDLDKAKALLAEAGVKDLTLTYTFSQADPVWEPVGIALQAGLAQIGVKLELQNLADTAKREQAAQGKYDLTAGAWTPDYADPYMFMNYWFDPARMGGPGNRAFYNNDKVASLVRQAAEITDQPKREALYLEAQKIAIADAPYLLLMQKNDIFVRRAAVQGYVYNPMLLQVYNLAEMSKSE